MKYRAYLTNDYYVMVDGCLEWAADQENWLDKVEIKQLGETETLEDAKQLIYDAGRLQDAYPSCFVETKEDGEVYSSIPAVTKCESCGHEDWDRIET